MEASQVAYAHVAQRISVISAMKRQEFCLLRLRPGTLPPILKGHLQGHFDCGRAVIGKENMLESRRRQFDQPPSQPNGRNIRQTQERAVGHLVQLISNRLIQFWNPMAVNVAP